MTMVLVSLVVWLECFLTYMTKQLRILKFFFFWCKFWFWFWLFYILFKNIFGFLLSRRKKFINSINSSVYFYWFIVVRINRNNLENIRYYLMFLINCFFFNLFLWFSISFIFFLDVETLSLAFSTNIASKSPYITKGAFNCFLILVNFRIDSSSDGNTVRCAFLVNIVDVSLSFHSLLVVFRFVLTEILANMNNNIHVYVYCS